ncbi:MAG: DUF4386 domain-containing protein [Aggregatilineales bacterium]
MNTQQQTITGVNIFRMNAMTAGILYLITHVTAIGSAILYNPILKDTHYIIGRGFDTQVILGALLEVILALAVVGTSLALFPAVKRWNESVALGYIGLRTLEASVIIVGALPLLVLVALRQNMMVASDADTMTLITFANVLVSFHNWTLLLGPGLVCGTNTVFMAYLMYKSRLVPRFIPVLGLVGGPLIFAYTVAQMFGSYDQTTLLAGVTVIPIFTWELILAIRLITRGFKQTETTFEPAPSASYELVSVA